jgi:hypothetical protein
MISIMPIGFRKHSLHRAVTTLGKCEDSAVRTAGGPSLAEKASRAGKDSEIVTSPRPTLLAVDDERGCWRW